MKILIFLVGLFSVFCSFANNIIVNGTRFIYPGNDKEITIQMTNTADRPAIAQSWLDSGNPNETPDTIKTPFQITPPIARIEAKGGQILRIKLVNKTAMPMDRETLWWLNILDIPAMAKNDSKSENVLQLAIRSRFKFIYRPSEIGNPPSVADSLSLVAKGHQLTLANKSPFYITVTKISTDEKNSLNPSTIMIAPFSTETTKLNKDIKAGSQVIISTLNDYGANVKSKVTIK